MTYNTEQDDTFVFINSSVSTYNPTLQPEDNCWSIQCVRLVSNFGL